MLYLMPRKILRFGTPFRVILEQREESRKGVPPLEDDIGA